MLFFKEFLKMGRSEAGGYGGIGLDTVSPSVI